MDTGTQKSCGKPTGPPSLSASRVLGNHVYTASYVNVITLAYRLSAGFYWINNS